MRFPIMMLTGALMLAPMSASAGGFDLRLGGFFPQAESSLFYDVTDLFVIGEDTIHSSDWTGLTGGAELNMKLVRNVEIGFHVDAYGRTLHTADRDYVYPNGREILQSHELSVVPVGVSLRLIPTSRRARVAPYIGVGVDLLFWQYEEWGEFVDYDTEEIFDDAFYSEGVTPGFHVAGGIRLPIGDDFCLVGEARYQWAEDDMGDDFRGYELDLSGATATLGVHLQF